jgi:nitronate monooxygenase
MTAPIIGAPMAGGPTTPELVAAVSDAGGLGSLGSAYSTAEQIERDVARVRELTTRPFAVNLFAPESRQPAAGDVNAVVQFLRRYHVQLGIAPPEMPSKPMADFETQIETLLRLKVPVVSFTIGVLPENTMRRLKQQQIFTVGTATTVDEAERLDESGVDAIVAQGSEAGAHRGTFAHPAEDALIGTMALVPQVVDAVRVPVIASGGIMDGRGIVAALALGAQAVQMGTAFLCCDEAGTSAPYREALLSGREDQTTITRAFSGRAARGLRNDFMREWDAAALDTLPFPWHNALTGPMRRAAAKAGNRDLLSLWAGQGVRMLRRGSARDIMQELRHEIEAVLAQLRT